MAGLDPAIHDSVVPGQRCPCIFLAYDNIVRRQGAGMIEITGLNELTKQLEDAQKALDDIDGEIGTVSFDPHDPVSIELAIKNMEALIDENVGHYADNPIIAPLISDMKERYRASILEQAASARLKDST